MDYSRECGTLIDVFEVAVRSFVSTQMESHFGEKWWRTNVPPAIASACQERQNAELSKRFPRIQRVVEPIFYTNLGELKDVICRNDNFDAVFKHYFNNKANVTARVDELIGYRNPAAHNRPVFEEIEYQAIIATGRSLLEAMEVELPAEFQTSSIQVPATVDTDSETTPPSGDDFAPKPRCFHNLPRPDYSDFFGREEEREEILEHISHPRAWITLIDGIGGVGKTALALNCAEHIKESAVEGKAHFEYVIWASAKTERLNPTGVVSLQPSFTDLNSLTQTILEVTGFGDYQGDDPKALVIEILTISKTLLVLDNLETVTDPELYDFLQQVPAPSKVLATTRSRIEGSHKNLRLTALPTNDAIEMIRKLAIDLDSPELGRESDASLLGLIDRVGGIPLAIKLAVGRIATGMPFQSYLDKLDTGAAQHDLLEFCFAESWDNLEQEAKRVLSAVILFSEDPSEVELRLVTGIPELRLNEAIGILTRRAFLNRSYDRERETYRYSVLPLTADFIRQESEKDPDRRAQLQDGYNSYLLEKGRFEEAIEQITHLLPQSASMPEEEKLSNMLVESAWRAYQGGDYREAVSRLENATGYRDTAYLNHTWAVIERDEGRYGTARDKFSKAVALDESRLRTWRSWGRMEQRLGNWQRAVNVFTKACALPGSDAQDFHGLGVCLSRLANTKRSPDNEEMLIHAEKALKDGFYRNPLGYRETHHNVVNCHSLALTLDRLGRTNEALIQCSNGLALEPHNERLIDLNLSLQRK